MLPLWSLIGLVCVCVCVCKKRMFCSRATVYHPNWDEHWLSVCHMHVRACDMLLVELAHEQWPKILAWIRGQV